MSDDKIINKYDSQDGTSYVITEIKELEPCPFCGNKKIRMVAMKRETPHKQRSFWTDCPTSNCIQSGQHRSTKRLAITAWNRRHA